MEHTGGVRGAQRAQYVQPDAGGLERVDPSGLLGGVGQRRPVDVLHDDPGPRVVLEHVMDGDDSGVADPGGGPGLFLGAGMQDNPVGLGGVATGRQLLDRDNPVQHLVMCAPDLAHAAAADRLAQPVTPGEQETLARALTVFHVPRPVPWDHRLRR